jgi:hypothetical protein
MMAPLFNGIELTPGQLSELRAIDSLYYTQLATRPAKESGAPATAGSELDDWMLARMREMLDDRQRATFDRNRSAGGSRGMRYDDRIEPRG